ncbi:hypothetical protein QO034_06595 [Sedimentitalea sp. JM2-8]|uniref:Uncharacterized protein n=1 Tax=Sedimentitalea xiamensis TaxID=3050037 RepID=A0ABT7FCC8_9RHOB|nr:hypothetical protein [Sedimentitalea xiamensis]MDK3072773.1 hypothetical protein [Sedimentitalea xiamensis]
MALSFPLPLSEFLDTLPVSRVTFRLEQAVTSSETGGGEVIRHARGARLWGGEIVLDRDYHAVWAAIEARIALLEEPGASFLITDTRLPGPIADPDGSILGAAAVQILSVNANSRELRLKGLPPGYAISQGDMLSFSYGSNPVRRALHRVVTGAVANGSGNTPNFEVTPFIRPGAAVDAAVTLVAPVCKAVLASADIGASRAAISDGGTFAWRQTLR